LFANDNERGEALLAYLMSLGAETKSERLDLVQNWTLEATGSAEDGAQLYKKYCIQCHGAEANGKGPMMTKIGQQARDLINENIYYAPESLDAETRRHALARLIKFGIPNTTMPGHEYLSDTDIASLTDYVLSIRREKQQEADHEQ
jgi:cytochrome c oxidase cbb3-type subunit 2